MCLVSYNCTLYRGHGHLQDHVFPRELEIHICVIIKYLKGKDIDVYFSFFFLNKCRSQKAEIFEHQTIDLAENCKLKAVKSYSQTV